MSAALVAVVLAGGQSASSAQTAHSANAKHDFSAAIFSTYEPLVLRLEAPLDDLFAHAQQANYSVHGALTYQDRRREVRVPDVKVSVRGNSSRNASECTFPKLKLEWPSASLKIGTHCGESTDGSLTAKFGRLPNERSPRREAFVYQLLDELQVPSLKARPARITYVSSGQEALVRNALVLEDTSDALRRLGAQREIAPEQFTSARDAFAPADSATLAFGEAMIGNFDWCLRFFPRDTYRCDARRPLWNVLAFASPDGRMRPLMYDFDVSGMVAGHHRWFADIFDGAFLPSASPARLEVISQLQRTRTLFGRGDLDRTRRQFTQKKTDAYRLLGRERSRFGRTRDDQAISRRVLRSNRIGRRVLSTGRHGAERGRLRRRAPRRGRVLGAWPDTRRHSRQRSGANERRHDSGTPARRVVALGSAGQVSGHAQDRGVDRQDRGQSRLSVTLVCGAPSSNVSCTGD